MALSATELAALQAAVNATLDQTCVIKRNTAGALDGAGHSTQVLTTIATVSCHVSEPTSQLMQNYDFLIGSTSTWLVRLPVGTSVRENDLLTIGGQTLRVQVLLSPRSYPVALRVLAAEVQ